MLPSSKRHQLDTSENLRDTLVLTVRLALRVDVLARVVCQMRQLAAKYTIQLLKFDSGAQLFGHVWQQNIGEVRSSFVFRRVTYAEQDGMLTDVHESQPVKVEAV